MKKAFILLLALLSVLTLSACAAKAASTDRITQPIAQTNAPAAPDAQSTQSPDAVPVETPAPDATPEPLPESGDSVAFATPDPLPDSAAQDGELTAEAAQAIALAHAGLTADQVTYVRTHHDWDDGCAEYEIEFYCGDREYDYDIDARTGAIRSFDTELEHHSGHHKEEQPSHHGDHHTGSSATPAPQRSDLLTKDEAKAIALAHAGVSEADARFEKAELDTDDGRREYEIEFKVGRTEYEYDIDAVTGKIVKADKDYDD